MIISYIKEIIGVGLNLIMALKDVYQKALIWVVLTNKFVNSQKKIRSLRKNLKQLECKIVRTLSYGLLNQKTYFAIVPRFLCRF